MSGPIGASIITLILLIIFLTIIGSAILALIDRDRDQVGQALLAATTGFCAILIPGFWVAYLGIPLEVGGSVIFASETICAIVVLAILRRTPLYAGAALSVALTLTVSLVLTAWPLAKYGWNWIAFGNGDWAFYITNAEALFKYGYSLPSASGVISDRDILFVGTFDLHTSGRQGAEIFLAEIMSLFRQSAVHVYMPAMLVAQILVVQVSMALAWFSIKRRFIAVLVGGAVALSPELSYGVLFQLLPQQLGIALLGASLIRLLSFFDRTLTLGQWRGWLVPAMLVAGNILVYPELATFLAGAIVFAVFFALISRVPITNSAKGLVAAVALGCLIVVCDLPAALQWVLQASNAVKGSGQSGAYPSYLQLEGLLDFWGLHTIGTSLGDYPFAVLLLMCALILSLITIFAVFDFSKRRLPSALILLPMLAIASRSIYNGADFPVFKLAMYSQPFVISLLIIWCAVRVFRVPMTSV